jgi:hypothetical protein
MTNSRLLPLSRRCFFAWPFCLEFCDETAAFLHSSALRFTPFRDSFPAFTRLGSPDSLIIATLPWQLLGWGARFSHYRDSLRFLPSSSVSIHSLSRLLSSFYLAGCPDSLVIATPSASYLPLLSRFNPFRDSFPAFTRRGVPILS